MKKFRAFDIIWWGDNKNNPKSVDVTITDDDIIDIDDLDRADDIVARNAIDCFIQVQLQNISKDKVLGFQVDELLE